MNARQVVMTVHRLMKINVFRYIGIITLLFNLNGCAALVAGAAGGAGTAVWLSGKLTQEFHASYDQTVSAAKAALDAQELPLVKETHDTNVTQLKSKYTDGKDIWIDIHRVSANATKVEVRVGGVSPDKEAASGILKEIQDRLVLR